jgi:3-isopropylmalate/(R)-2-methylmalate dehydratase large subunit
MGMTMAEKILARASGKPVVHPGEYVTANIDVLMGHDRSFYTGFSDMVKCGYDKVWDPNKIVVACDHSVPAADIGFADRHRKMRGWVKSQGIGNFYDVGVGICHQVLPEKGHALPGTLIVGGDSHTTTYGAFGSAATGIGYGEVTYVMAKGTLWFMVPESIRFMLNGVLPKGISGKDIILHIAGKYTVEVAQYKSAEFLGPVAKALSMSQRMCISNMGVEIGAKFAFFEADEKTLAYLKKITNQPVQPFGPDPDAQYEKTYELNLSSLEPQIACPHSIDNVKPVSQVEDIPVHQAFLGSCTNGREDDLEQAAAILKGKKIHSGTRLLVIAASQDVYNKIAKSGALQIFMEAGAMVCPSCCGPCAGTKMGVIGPEETAISTTNRNYKGRMGSPEGFVYLASPATVAASAVEGKITDPRKYLG